MNPRLEQLRQAASATEFIKTLTDSETESFSSRELIALSLELLRFLMEFPQGVFYDPTSLEFEGNALPYLGRKEHQVMMLLAQGGSGTNPSFVSVAEFVAQGIGEQEVPQYISKLRQKGINIHRTRLPDETSAYSLQDLRFTSFDTPTPARNPLQIVLEVFTTAVQEAYGFSYDLTSFQLSSGSESVKLTAVEHRLFLYFLQHEAQSTVLTLLAPELFGADVDLKYAMLLFRRKINPILEKHGFSLKSPAKYGYVFANFEQESATQKIFDLGHGGEYYEFEQKITGPLGEGEVHLPPKHNQILKKLIELYEASDQVNPAPYSFEEMIRDLELREREQLTPIIYELRRELKSVFPYGGDVIKFDKEWGYYLQPLD